MSNFDKVSREFQNLGYNVNSYLTQSEIYKALDDIIKKNSTMPQFDRIIAQQLYYHTQPDQSRGVKLSNFINSILEGQNLLRQQMYTTQNALTIENNPQKRSQLQDQLNQIISDHYIITYPFRLQSLPQANSNEVSGILRNRVAAPMSNQTYQRHPDSVIFGYDPNSRQQSSTDLKICMFLAIFMLVLQTILMFHKHHFLNMLCIFGILSIFFLNYFDKNYIKFLLILIAASIVLDFVWLGVHARQYWSPQPLTQHSTLHSGFLAFIFIMVMVLMGLKIVAGGILFKYRNNSESYRKNISALGYRIKLDGKPTYNPFSPLLRSAIN